VLQEESARIETVTVDGKGEQVLIGSETTPLAFAWAGGAIYYLRRNGTAVQLWEIPVSPETGRARGRPALLIPALERGSGFVFQSGSGEFSVAADGTRLVFIRAVPRGNLFALSVRPGPGIASTVRELTTGTRTIGGMKLSPDGQRVAFAAGRSGSIDIFVVSAEGGSPQQLTFMNFRAGANFAWSPDGRDIAFCAEDGTGWHVWTMSALGGTPRKLARTNAIPWCFIAWGPAGRLVYIATGPRSSANGGHARVLDLVTEQERPLVQDDTSGLMNAPQISPDGKQVAVQWGRPDGYGLWTISLVDSSRRRLADMAVPMRWSPQGDVIYAYGVQDVLKVPAGGGAASIISRLPPDWNCVDEDITPDGRRLICSKDETQRDAWMIENFDPNLPAVKP
jgi:Tol biopolymer transport system component